MGNLLTEVSSQEAYPPAPRVAPATATQRTALGDKQFG